LKIDTCYMLNNSANCHHVQRS